MPLSNGVIYAGNVRASDLLHVRRWVSVASGIVASLSTGGQSRRNSPAMKSIRKLLTESD